MQYLAKSINQGYNYTSYALDTALWGAIFLAGIGRSDIANSSVNNTAAYQITLGAQLAIGHISVTAHQSRRYGSKARTVSLKPTLR